MPQVPLSSVHGSPFPSGLSEVMHLCSGLIAFLPTTLTVLLTRRAHCGPRDWDRVSFLCSPMTRATSEPCGSKAKLTSKTTRQKLPNSWNWQPIKLPREDGYLPLPTDTLELQPTPDKTSKASSSFTQKPDQNTDMPESKQQALHPKTVQQPHSRNIRGHLLSTQGTGVLRKENCAVS